MPAGTTAKRETAPDLHDLMAALDYAFNDTELLRIALLHPSAVSTGRGKRSKKPEPRIDRGVDNQRLEFLGDRVLGIVVAEMLFRAFPATKMKARWRAALRHWCARTVSTRSRARSRSAAISPSPAARRGRRPRQSRHPRRCLRSLDRRDLSRRQPRNRADLRRAPLAPEDGCRGEAAAGRQDGFAGMGAGRRPRAAALHRGEERGAAARSVFEVEVTVAGQLPASARGRSKRAAEQAAARQLLDRVGARPRKSEASPPVSRCGFVAILGAPNAGKSTWSTARSARRSRSSAPRCRPPAAACSAS